MRSLLRALRHLPDRLSHSRRRAVATQLIARSRPRRIVFGCLGNVCRSPYAEARFAAGGLDIVVDSAGFIGPGRNPPIEAQVAAEARYLDVSGHRSRLFTSEDLAADTLVVVMEPAHQERLRAALGDGPARVVLLGDLDPEPIDTRVIIDPWGRSQATFEATFDRIDRCVAALIAALPGAVGAPASRAG